MSGKLALIIGNSEYQDPQLARLVAPEADVEQLAVILKDPEIGGFDEINKVVNELSSTIRREIARFFKDRKPDDLLLLYFSGHGVRDDQGDLYLAVNDTEHDLLAGTAIPAAFITGEMDRSRSRRQVLILDCCHSGAFAQGAKGVLGESVGTATAFQGIGAGRVVLTATDATQYAWEGDRVVGEARNSVFTKYLINGLKTGEADTGGDGWITIDELYDYVYQQVVSATPKQIPGKWSYKQQGEIVLAKNPHPVVKPAELPPELRQSIEDSRSWVREGAVRELDRLMQSGNPGLTLAAYQALKPLTDDDSRRVSSAATLVIEAYETRLKARAEEEEKERRERGQAARVEPGRLEAEPLVGEIAEQAANAAEKADLERPPLVKSNQEPEIQQREAAQRAASLARASVLTKTIGLPVLVTAVASGIAWFLYDQFLAGSESSLIASVFTGAIGGFMTALILRQAKPSVQWQQILAIAVGWLIAWILGDFVFNPLYGGDSERYVNALIVSGLTIGGLGGLVTGLALWRKGTSILWKPVLFVAAGWALAFLITDIFVPPDSSESLASAIGRSIAGLIGVDVTDQGIRSINFAIGGSLAGLIGAAIMFWQLQEAPLQN